MSTAAATPADPPAISRSGQSVMPRELETPDTFALGQIDITHRRFADRPVRDLLRDW